MHKKLHFFEEDDPQIKLQCRLLIKDNYVAWLPVCPDLKHGVNQDSPALVTEA